MRIRSSARLLVMVALFAIVAANLTAQPGGGRKAAQPGGGKAKTAKGAAPPSYTYWAPTSQLVAIDEILRDLKLDPKQQDAVGKANADYLDAVQAPAGKKGTFAETLQKQQDAKQKFEDALKKTLGNKTKRLDQIAAQGAGLPAYFTPAKAQELELTDDQLAKGRDIMTAVYRDMVAKANKEGTRLSAVGVKGAENRTAYADKATIDLLQLLTKDQNKRWLEIIGDPVQPEVLLKVRTGSAASKAFGGFDGFNPVPFDGGKKKGKGFGTPATAATRLAASQRAFAAGSFVEAEDLARKALAFAKESTVERGECLIALGAALYNVNRTDDADSSLKDALAIFEKQLGPYNPRIASASSWLGKCAERRGQFDKAEPLLLKALDIFEKVEGANSQEAAQCWTDLGNVALAQKKLDEAENRHKKAMDIRVKTFAKDHPLIALSIHNLGIVYREQGKTKEAETTALRSVTMFRQTDPDHGDLVLPLRVLTDLCIKQKRWADAEKHARAWVSVVESDRPGSVNQLANASFKTLDTNSDGKLSPNEMPAVLRNNLAKWDKNGDGLLDISEYRDYMASRLGGVPANKGAGSPALIDPLDRLATILTAAGRRDEAAAVNQRKQDLKDNLAAQKKPATP